MRKTIFFFVLTAITFVSAQAGRVSGMVTDEQGNPLQYASVFIKGTTKGTTANNQGKYFLD